MRLIKKQFLALAILGMIAINLSGCTYAIANDINIFYLLSKYSLVK